MIKHWLHGNIKLNQELKKEDKCSECIHLAVCRFNMMEECVNYHFGTSEYPCENCLSCINRFTRWDKDQPIPCFKCKFFKKDKR